jgi:hypothetical protein
MFENKFFNGLLKLVPQRKWNLLSNMLARVSVSTIGSPISFRYKGYTLREFNLLEMEPIQRSEFLRFCYPLDLPDRKREIAIDRQYWPNTATFIVFDENNAIKGCAQYISKRNDSRIPIEFAHVIYKSGAINGDIGVLCKSLLPHERYAEVYRCRRSFDSKSHDSFWIIYMLFKAVWAKTIQESMQYLYISYNPEIKELYNLYTKKLCFQNAGVTIRFKNSSKTWGLLVKDCLAQENDFATVSRTHFFMQTWFRKNLKKKNLYIHPSIPLVGHLLPKQETILHTQVVKIRRRQTHLRRRISKHIIAKNLSAKTNSASQTIYSP